MQPKIQLSVVAYSQWRKSAKDFIFFFPFDWLIDFFRVQTLFYKLRVSKLQPAGVKFL